MKVLLLAVVAVAMSIMPPAPVLHKKPAKPVIMRSPKDAASRSVALVVVPPKTYRLTWSYPADMLSLVHFNVIQSSNATMKPFTTIASNLTSLSYTGLYNQKLAFFKVGAHFRQP